ncbi:hemolysin III [Clostridium tetanomorphum]|uniref:Hemolysin III family protein n=1 Tax=Clostridium tetanomorphum TaxID=1553 RepID=A0A923E9F4_CLOTT|nr:hemolysin III family protein [Clostridium tetanomorphum]KAJ50953.1 hemolysin III [Clostridium tetanomorphum DSM 665]MBC2396320.1 hemolysin III family protein [Clostridium tetanomorphum]MBP1863451.1 hemolysin III [Clostridium tetanomorphum]NRS83548.1 hemolysin III [Clostridium tetanomorphum]NRZ96748.1 hemolysin III [Clostridium tetanomorphum]
MENNFYTKREDIVNAITHGIGALLAIAALVILIVYAALKGTAWHVVSFSIYGATLVILYLESTLYHSLRGENVKKLFRKFDHMSIFILIAGTYTPYCLTVLRGKLGWTIFGIVWGCTILGIVLKAFYTGKKESISTMLYIIMGWLIIIAIKPLYLLMTFKGFMFLVIGGILYTAGTYFFGKDNMPYNHGIWHLFVIAGSILHFFSVMSLLNI